MKAGHNNAAFQIACCYIVHRNTLLNFETQIECAWLLNLDLGEVQQCNAALNRFEASFLTIIYNGCVTLCNLG